MNQNKNIDSSKSKNQRKQRRKELIKQDIINIAEKYFLEENFDNVMIEQVAILSGYSKATIYNYFSSKEEIFLGVFIKSFQVLTEILLNIEFEHGLQSLGQGYLVFVEKYPNYAKLFSSPQSLISILLLNTVFRQNRV